MGPLAAALPGGVQLPPFITDLVQLNVEAMDCRYCDDLDAYWNYLKRKLNVGDVRPPKIFDRLPSKLLLEKADRDKKEPDEKELKSGWIVEVRGFTFHHKSRSFVIDVFAENIARRGMPDFNLDKPLPYKGPIINRVSHVIVLPFDDNNWVKQTLDAESFVKIGGNYSDGLIKDAAAGAAAGPGGMGPMGQPLGAPAGAGMGTGNPRDAWVPANGAATGTAMGPRGPAGPAAPATSGNVTESKEHPFRTEFVVLFIWREPTPSDKLRGWDQVQSAAPQPGQP
jgi:hypothetical protein